MSPKAAKRMAAKALVARGWIFATAKPPLGEELAAVPDEVFAGVGVVAAEGEELDDGAAVASNALAFRDPHCSFVLQFCWPVASPTWSAIHCWKVAWQM